MQTAAPAGAIIWILANIHTGDSNLARAISDWLNPFGLLLGLDGVILLAYIIAIPANEIVVPTMMMVYMGAGMMNFRSARQRQRLDDAHRGQLDVVRIVA
jgi:ferrous iron transport protein B